MTQRLNAMQQAPDLFRKFVAFSTAVQASGFDQKLIDLVAIRTAQLNGCGFCLDMHVKEARLHGERDLRVLHLPVWRESPLFEPRERAALAWTEALTHLGEHGVPDEVYDRVRTQFSEKEITDLSFLVMVQNAWNRLNVGFRTTPGSADKAFGLDKAGLA